MEHSEAHNWIDPYDGNATNHTIVAGGSHLQSQARELGYGDANLLCTGGMVVHPAYYQRTASPVKPIDRIERRSVREQQNIAAGGGTTPARLLLLAADGLSGRGSIRQPS